MAEQNDTKMVYPNHIAQTWEKLFNPRKRQTHYLALIAIGGLLNILAVSCMMFYGGDLNENAATFVYALGAVGIAITGMALLGLHVLILNLKALQVALYGSDSEPGPSPSKDG